MTRKSTPAAKKPAKKVAARRRPAPAKPGPAPEHDAGGIKAPAAAENPGGIK